MSAPRAPRAALLALALVGLAEAAVAAEDWAAQCRAAPRVGAVEPCTHALAADPQDVEAERRLAWGLLATYRETEAIDRFAGIAARRPTDVQAQFDLASVLAGLRMYEAAVPHLRRTLALAPEAVGPQRLAAILFLHTGDFAGAHAAHRALADAGVPTGLFDLAQDYAQGRGTDPNQAQARHWYERAAAAGHVRAMRVLAEKLEYGAFGTPPEPQLAQLWRARAEAAVAGLPRPD